MKLRNSGKLLRVWAKNQLRLEIFEKILKFVYKNLNRKLIFYPFYFPSSKTLAAYWIGGLGGWIRVVDPGLGRIGWEGELYKSLDSVL